MAKSLTGRKPIYPVSGWELTEEKFTIENNYRNETMFSLGNGYLGFRGNFEEGYHGPAGTGLEGTYINGFYESEIIKYPEIAYGYAERSQTMLNVTNSKVIKLFIEDEEFSMMRGEVLDYKRTLDIREGLLRRRVVWLSPKGKKVEVNIERLISFNNKYLAAISYEVTPLNFSGKIKLISALDGDVANIAAGSDPRVGSGLHGRVLFVKDKGIDKNYGVIIERTDNSGLELACAMLNDIETENSFTVSVSSSEFTLQAEYEFNAEEGRKIRLNKYISYVTSNDFEINELPHIAKKVVHDAREEGFENIKRDQKSFMDDFWYAADVEIKGDDALQQGIRINMFHLLQSVGRDGKTNICAKGLSGEGYEGHYFWDTETYILPFFLYNKPEISRKLLEYRYKTLDRARKRAREMSHNRGALFPWRTINGEECSAYYPAGTAQYHINADIAFAIKRYMDASDDKEFIVKYGAEILFETARLWADLGFFNERRGGKFCIHMVTGPDEYSALVNNNCYTNMMARENLLYAYKTALWMKESCPEEYNKLAEKINILDEELELWKSAGEEMYIPYDDKLKIHLQDDGFTDRIPWDFQNTPSDNYPLLLHYHPLVIYRHQVCKQADMVLALFLLGDKFFLEDKIRDYDFYEKVTTHDSSLSTAIFSIVASEIGYYKKAYDYFMSTARMDLDDFHGNTKDGIHAANMAGTWMCLVNGFAGMRAYEGTLSFNPYLPEGWEEYSFKVNFRNRIIKITVSKSDTVYELIKGEPFEILHNGIKKMIE